MTRSLAITSLVLSGVAIFLPGAVAGWAFVAAFTLSAAAAARGERAAVALLAGAMALGMWFMAPGGASGLLSALGRPPAAFFRANAVLLDLASISALVAIGLLAFHRRGPVPFAAAVEAAEDIERGVVAIGRLASYLFVPMMLVILYDVTQRKLLDFDNSLVASVFYLSSTKLQELEWHLHGTLFCLALGLAYVHDAHVRIELVRDRLSSRTKVWLELAGVVAFLLAYCLVVVKFGCTFAWRAYMTNEVSSAQTGLSHRWVIKAVLPLGFTVLAASGVAAAIRCLAFLYGPPEVRGAGARYTGAQHATARMPN